MLTLPDVIPYLTGLGLLSRASVVAGDVRVFVAPRRNHNFKVRRADGPSLFLKQGQIRDGFSNVRREADVYALLNGQHSERRYRYAPRFVNYDAAEDVLAVELLDDSVDLRQSDASRRLPSLRAATRLGTALASLHAFVPVSTAAELLGHGEPGVLTAHRPGLVLLRDFSAASIDLVRMIQAHPEVIEQLEKLRAAWRPEAFIHHDARWDNVLVGPRANTITLIDWETAAVGDPAWDVGAVLADYVSQWLLSIPSSGNAPPEQVLHLARRPLNTFHPAMSALWLAYQHHSGLSGEQSHNMLKRVTKFTGLKLLQSGIEQVQSAPRWTVAALCQLQVGTNLMARPTEGSRQLLKLASAA